ncbi:ion transporter [Aestuariibacter halophilus]|uniref:Ion transporter n=1 Tax=Fluctibacter halophilus TaxID=226011 RepID=A0ABS8G6I1_9ALTE|nr:ion transporter [Aestuariibacter halophilus]MCC2616192.1 ion transporter [Aestuariibacter halophilus]
MLRFNRQNLNNSHEGPWLLLDLVMLGLLVINLLWLILDMLYASRAIYDTLAIHWPAFVDAYQPIHDNFALIDLIFIGIFLSEFCLRWVVSIVRKEYLRWYFFPFIHWYDLVGCIPASGARIFRFLRIFSILYRLHKYQIIDLRSTRLFRFMAFYYDVFVEELSDRIVVKVLSDAQKDIASGSPLLEDITRQVLAPRQRILCEWLAAMMEHMGSSIADAEHGATVREHVQSSVGKAVRDNPNISTLKLVPVLGGTIERTLESSVTDIVTQSLINLLKDVTPDKIEHFIDNGLNRFTTEEQALEDEVLLVVNECLELLKSHVSTQRWKSAFETQN